MNQPQRDTATIWFCAFMIVLICFVGFVFMTIRKPAAEPTPGVGAPGTRAAIEEYIPAIKYNDGYYSLLGMTLSGSDADIAVSGGAGITIGSSGTETSNLVYGNCNLFASTTAYRTVAASTSVTIDCQTSYPLISFTSSVSALSGVQVGDNCMVHAPTTTPTTGNGISVNGYGASTTAGYIPVTLINNTGASIVLASSTLNNWQYVCRR